MVVISDGIYENNGPVEGVRYPSPEHMSGWWLTTELYNGDIKTLKNSSFQVHIRVATRFLNIYGLTVWLSISAWWGQ
ncbi:hypothetical protein ISG33_14330 [Glaciecola sp. MH2013]|uniref:hypothetical protein n=1 Tax=Glaciecola sp. MH2013 TaxID=2785524 RepID=UPI0018A06D94|nr:hypothetical protein [Glaciecola sp. MH2013]MBF7074579.1 hypothetical protein [Glaciecola sp. MH2013]